MTKLTRYEEAFWGPEFTSTAGFDALSRHNNEEKKHLHEYEEFLRKRSKIELEYSKSMAQLAKSLKEHTVVGTLDLAWNCVKAELDSIKQTHEEAGLFFSQHAEETKRLRQDLTTRRDAAEDRLKKVQSQKNSQYNKVMSLYKTYCGKCRETDQANEQYATLRRQVTSTVKDLDKAKSKADKSEEEAAKADSQYKTGIHTLEDMRMEWEKEMEQACRDFQESDKEQITFLRSEMWQAVNRDSQVALDIDESSERVRQILEQCDVDQDVHSFIAAYTTGTERPERVLYQNYYTDTANGGGGGGGGNQPSPRQDARQNRSSDPQTRVPMMPPVTHSFKDTSVYSVPDDDPTYSTIRQVPNAGLRELTVKKSYQSQDGFAVRPGDKVMLVRQTAPNMLQVQTADNKCSNIPANIVERL